MQAKIYYFLLFIIFISLKMVETCHPATCILGNSAAHTLKNFNLNSDLDLREIQPEILCLMPDVVKGKKKNNPDPLILH